MDFIELKNVFKVYKNGVSALADLNLTIKKGEFVFIIGQSGSGKSTLTKLLYREERPNRGEVLVGGINVAKLRNSNVYKLRRKIGVVFQDFKLLPKLTVYENVAYPLETYGMSRGEIREKVLVALERVGLKERMHSFPNELSGGEQQRVGLARAIVNEPKLIICDDIYAYQGGWKFDILGDILTPPVIFTPVRREKFWNFYHFFSKYIITN